jgi:hypothetical protein
MKIEKLDDKISMLSSGNDIVDIRFWLGMFRIKINQLIDVVNTLTEAPKTPQEESRVLDRTYVPKPEVSVSVDFVPDLTQGTSYEDEGESEYSNKVFEAEIRADERAKLYKALLERDLKMSKYYKNSFEDSFEGGYPMEWDEPFTH